MNFCDMKITGKVLTLSFFYINYGGIVCLENGLALTPPMGWLAWEQFKCNTNCDDTPQSCISENLFISMADRLVHDGYRDVGYKYVNIDDCWMAHYRDSLGNMVADPERFPHGIKFLADYMHERGLKLGIYQNFGSITCMGYPGIVGHMEQDAVKFAEWEVDMVKLDGCLSDPNDMDDGYTKMGGFLNKTNRPILYSCSWPYYQLITQMEPNYASISSHCNLWRNFHDINPSWKTIEEIISFFGDNQEVLSQHTGPGHWIDPDMILIGNPGLSPGQARIQMAVWCMIPAPLLMSNDLRLISPIYRSILTNVKAIAINQDHLGLPGKRIYKKNLLEIWTRPILPSYDNVYSLAVLFINKQSIGVTIKLSLKQLGLKSDSGYYANSIFEDLEISEIIYRNHSLSVDIGSIDASMYKFQLIVK